MIPKSKHISPPWFGAGKDLIDMGLPNRQVKRDVYGSGYATLARLSWVVHQLAKDSASISVNFRIGTIR